MLFFKFILEWVNIISGIFSGIAFELWDIRRKLSRHSWPTEVMEKRIVDELDKVNEAQTIHKRKQWSRSDHTCGGSSCGVTLVSTSVTTLVSRTHVGAYDGDDTRLRRHRIKGRTWRNSRTRVRMRTRWRIGRMYSNSMRRSNIS